MIMIMITKKDYVRFFRFARNLPLRMPARLECQPEKLYCNVTECFEANLPSRTGLISTGRLRLPYSPNLCVAPDNLFLFPKLKMTLEGTRFAKK